ncbi:hypothetical protein [Marinobacter zhejiangensis]|nr:hypothetical protein [Marinobacter zhejiangensis]
MKYVIWVIEDDDSEALYTGPVASSDADYLAKVIPLLEPISNAEYRSGLAAILSTAARFSYILLGDDIVWCIEWSPGFIVVKFTPDGQILGAAIRALNPCFGGREATDEELDAFDEDNNPHYNLIFDPWDAQFEEDYRESGNFQRANEEELARYQSALKPVSDLEALDEASFEQCKANICEWAGKGLVILP